MRINRVLPLGKVTDAGPKLTYSEQGKPECLLTQLLTEPSKAGQEFSLFIHVSVYGTGAEQVAEQVDAGDLVSVDRAHGCPGRSDEACRSPDGKIGGAQLCRCAGPGGPG